jgi:elongation factor G
MQIAIGKESDFKGAVNLLEMKAIIWNDELGSKPEEQEIPQETAALAEEKRKELIEKVAELDDALIEKFLNEEEITIDEIKRALRKAVLANEATSILRLFIKK